MQYQIFIRKSTVLIKCRLKLRLEILIVRKSNAAFPKLVAIIELIDTLFGKLEKKVRGGGGAKQKYYD